MFSKVRSTNQSTWPKLSIDPLKKNFNNFSLSFRKIFSWNYWDKFNQTWPQLSISLVYLVIKNVSNDPACQHGGHGLNKNIGVKCSLSLKLKQKYNGWIFYMHQL